MAARDGEKSEQLDDMEERQLRSQAVQTAQAEDHSVERDVLEYLAETDLSDQDKELLKDYVTRDFVLANVDGAEYNELKWELRVLKETMRLFWPPQDCLVTGEDRAAINDDPSDEATPMSQQDRLRLEAFFRNIRLRLTRSRNMKQQEMLRTSIAQTHVQRGNQDNNSGLTGKFKNWRS